MKNLVLSILLVLFALNGFAQAPFINWEISIGGSQDDHVKSVIEADDGGIVVLGHTYSTDGDVSGHNGYIDIWVAKLSSAGSLQWAKCFGGSSEDRGNAIVQAADGGFIIAGETYSSDGDVSNQLGDGDVWILKLDAAGNLEWEKTLGGTMNERVNSIVPTFDGGYMITGDVTSMAGDLGGFFHSHHLYAAKLDSVANVEWFVRLGGDDYELGNDIHQTADSGFILTGWAKSTDGWVTGVHGEGDVWVVRLASNGAFVWGKCLGGSLWDMGETVGELPDGNYLVSGYTGSNDGDPAWNNGQADLWIVKLDTAGDIIWEKTYGGSENDFAHDMELTADGGSIQLGYVSSNDGDVVGNHGFADGWVVRLDSAGDMLWQKSLGGSLGEFFYAMHATSDGGYVLAGESLSSDGDVSTNKGRRDIWVVKIGGIVGMAEAQDQPHISVFPNPVTDRLSVDLGDSGSGKPHSLRLNNSMGQVVYRSEEFHRLKTIDLSAIPTTGIYFLQVLDQKGKVIATEKVLKE